MRRRLTERTLVAEERGVTAIEYGLLASLIAIVTAAGIGLVGDGVVILFQRAADAFP